MEIYSTDPAPAPGEGQGACPLWKDWPQSKIWQRMSDFIFLFIVIFIAILDKIIQLCATLDFCTVFA